MQGEKELFEPLQEKPKIDVVFLIDGSRSMHDIITAIKEGINKIYDGLLKLNFYLRGKVFAYDRSIFMWSDFVEDPGILKEYIDEILMAIEKGELGKREEFTLPALDWALDSDWKSPKRTILLFTDECLEQGFQPDFQRSKWNELLEKIRIYGVRLIYIGPACKGRQDYNSFIDEAKGAVKILIDKKDFTQASKEELFNSLVKSISSTSNASQIKPSALRKDLYGIENQIKIIKL